MRKTLGQLSSGVACRYSEPNFWPCLLHALRAKRHTTTCTTCTTIKLSSSLAGCDPSRKRRKKNRLPLGLLCVSTLPDGQTSVCGHKFERELSCAISRSLPSGRA